MARHSGSRIKTFTLGFFDPKGATAAYNELETARRTAEHLGSEHHELLVTHKEIRESIPEVLDHCDEPFATSSAIPTYLISRLARESVTVALSGDGPDELFAGYRAYLLEPFVRIYMRLPQFLRHTFIERIAFGLPTSDATFVTRNIRRGQRFLRSLNTGPADRFFRLTNKFSDVPPETIYDTTCRTLSLDLAERMFKRYYDEPLLKQDVINSMLYVDTNIKLVDHILTKVDLMSMKTSLEVRSPFLDYRIAELAFRLPGSMKIKRLQKKYLLRETFRELLPSYLFKLPKRGFEIPVGEWLKHEMRAMFLDTMAPHKGSGVLNEELIKRLYHEHCQNWRDHGEKLWILFVLRWWARKHQINI
jgi:asparagine synthase (glutamine-hydrolysing)